MISQITTAQNKGVVKFLVDNDNGYFEVLLNDTLVIKKYKDSLAVGNYKAQIWSYGYDAQDVEFTIEKDSVTEVYVRLNRSTAYQAYNQSYHNYRVKFHKSHTLPVSISIALGITSSVFMVKAYNLQKKINTDIGTYSQSSSSTEIDAIKAQVSIDNAKYNKLRAGFYITSGLTIVGIATSIYSAIHFSRYNTEPTYSKESPFKDKMTFQFYGTGGALIFRLG